MRSSRRSASGRSVRRAHARHLPMREHDVRRAARAGHLLEARHDVLASIRTTSAPRSTASSMASWRSRRWSNGGAARSRASRRRPPPARRGGARPAPPRGGRRGRAAGLPSTSTRTRSVTSGQLRRRLTVALQLALDAAGDEAQRQLAEGRQVRLGEEAVERDLGRAPADRRCRASCAAAAHAGSCRRARSRRRAGAPRRAGAR